MPNTGHYSRCPFFSSEREKVITCEDVFRRFRSKTDKDNYMWTYCDTDWEECKYARELLDLYDRIEKKGETVQMMEIFRHRTGATRAELKKVATQLGKAEARCVRQNEEIEKLKTDLENLREKNKELFKMHADFKADQRRKDEKLLEEMMDQASIYESYLAYLMDQFAGGSIDIEAAAEWGTKYKYLIKGSMEDGKLKSMLVETQEVGEEDGDQGPAGKISATGTAEDEEDGKEIPLPGNDR